MHFRKRWLTALLLCGMAFADTLRIEGPVEGRPGEPHRFRLLRDGVPAAAKWKQVTNPDRYSGDEYISSFELRLAPGPDGSVTATPPSPGRYKIVAEDAGVRAATYLLVRPESPKPVLRGVSLAFWGNFDAKLVERRIVLLKQLGMNAVHIYWTQSVNVESGHFEVGPVSGPVTGTPSKAELAWLVPQLQQAGIEVLLGCAAVAWQDGAWVELQNYYGERFQLPPLEAVEAYARLTVNCAQTARDAGAARLILGNNIPGQSPRERSHPSMLEAVRSTKAIFPGPVYFGWVFPCDEWILDWEWFLADGIHVPGSVMRGNQCSQNEETFFNPPAEWMARTLNSQKESQVGFRIHRATGLPLLWTDVWAMPFDGIGSGLDYFLPALRQSDRQEPVDLFEACMRAVREDTEAFLPWLMGFYYGSENHPDGVDAQPALAAAIANWFGGDAAAFASCGFVRSRPEFDETFNANGPCPLGARLNVDLEGGGSRAAEIGNPGNSVASFPGSGAMIVQDPAYREYRASFRMRVAEKGDGVVPILNLRGGRSETPSHSFHFWENSVVFWPAGAAQPARNASPGLGVKRWVLVELERLDARFTLKLDGRVLYELDSTQFVSLPGGFEVGVCCGGSASRLEIDDVKVELFGSWPDWKMLHSAARSEGPVAPYTLVDVEGSGIGADPQSAWGQPVLPLELGGVRVWFGDTPAPIISVDRNGIRAVVPPSVAEARQVTARIEQNGASVLKTIAVNPRAPALMTVDSTGAGLAAAVNEDGQANAPGQPAAAGSTIQVWLSGAGLADDLMDPAETLSVPHSLSKVPLRAWIGGMKAEVVSASYEPGSPPIQARLVIRIPAGAGSDDQAPLLVGVGQYLSQLGVWLAVQ